MTKLPLALAAAALLATAATAQTKPAAPAKATATAPKAKPAPRPRAVKPAATGRMVTAKTSTGKTITYNCSLAGNKTKAACK